MLRSGTPIPGRPGRPNGVPRAATGAPTDSSRIGRPIFALIPTGAPPCSFLGLFPEHASHDEPCQFGNEQDQQRYEFADGAPLATKGGRGVRILVVVLSLDREPWRTLEAAQRETWLAPSAVDEVVHLRGIHRGPARAGFLLLRKAAVKIHKQHVLDSLVGRIGALRKVEGRGNIVRTSTFEYWIGTSAKMHAGLRFLIENYRFDYLVRTNSSTYIHLPTLRAHLKSAPRNRYYAGPVYKPLRNDLPPEVPYAQGTCIVLSRDVAALFASDGEWDYDTTDDVATGRAARRLGIQFNPLPQLIVEDSTDLKVLIAEAPVSAHIFRFKSVGDRLADKANMHALHALLIEPDKPSLRA